MKKKPFLILLTVLLMVTVYNASLEAQWTKDGVAVCSSAGAQLDQQIIFQDESGNIVQ